MTCDKQDVHWYVYILRTAASTLYTGISTDPLRRLQEHESGVRGARSLRGRGPLQLLRIFEAPDRSIASQVEAAIKKLPKPKKELLASGELTLEGCFATAFSAVKDASKP